MTHHPKMIISKFVRFTFVFLLRSCFFVVVARIECTSTFECEETFREGSICNEDGYCTNPFASGCLSSSTTARNDGKYKKNDRMCNSQDDSNSNKFCTDANLHRHLSYPEISIFANDWESAIVIGWIAQILLSEVLGVPASMQTGKEGVLNFYDLDNSFEYPLNNHFDAMIEANSVNGDCSQSENSCAHFMPEVWTDPSDLGAMEVSKNGVIVTEALWITKHTIEKDPTFSNYYGLGGEQNRKKLAETFLQPTSWKDYCLKISKTRCEVDDGIAKRPPILADEKEYFYDDEHYKGHFRRTDKNNCTKYPDCTGHIVIYPCHWRSHAEKMMYWNDIALEAIEYTYGEILQITNAANATGSDLLVEWWAPSPLTEDLFRVTLPKPTTECLFQRSNAKSTRCEQNTTERRGNSGSGCDYAPNMVDKIFARTFADNFFTTPKAKRSPAYPFLKNFKMSDTSVGELLRDWDARDGIDYGYDGREVVCKWVANNMDLYANLTQYLPVGYPRVISNSNDNRTLPTIAILLSSIACVLVLVTGVATYYHRKQKIIIYAQPHFMYLFLLGYLTISVSAILYGMEASDSICMAREWTLLIGYTLGNVPLLVKTAAINKLLQNANKMKRVKITQTRLFTDIGVSVSVAIVYLICWTLIDPSTMKEELVLPVENKNAVDLIVGCSKPGIWSYIGSLFQASYVFCAFVLAVQSRGIVQNFNESKDVHRMAFVSFMFLSFRLIVQNVISTAIDPDDMNSIIGIILSSDTIANLAVYFAPKFVKVYQCDSSAFRDTTRISGLNDTTNPSVLRSSSYPSAVQNRISMYNNSNISGLTNHSKTSGAFRMSANFPGGRSNYVENKMLPIESVYEHCRQVIESGETEMSLSLLVESIESDKASEPLESTAFKTLPLSRNSESMNARESITSNLSFSENM